MSISDADLFAKLREIIQMGWIDIPDYYGYRGTGSPGLILEELIGINTNNRDGPDTGVWEIKYHGGSSPITLFHLEAQPRGNMHQIVRGYGWKDRNGRTSFRHTVWGSSHRGFRVINDSGLIIVRNEGADKDPDIESPYWTHDSLINAFVYKLRRLAVVHGRKKNFRVKYDSAHFYWEPNISEFINSIEKGVIAIDFDARTHLPPRKGIRNHGTKFRVKLDDLEYLYSKNQRFD